ncbi:hypothetical protein PAMP_024676 [Pampus punctatissimus]
MDSVLIWLSLGPPDLLKDESIRGRGMYLSDLTYIDSAYPSTGSILENEQRSNLMNNILRIISDLQRSCTYDIPVLPHVQKYLNSVRYIEELQKFVEDDNYKLSQKIEPGTITLRANASKEDLVGQEASASPLCGRKCTVAAEGTKVPATPPSPRNLLPYGHRKCHSLGYNFIHKMNTVEFKSATFPNAGSRHLLDDSVMESHSPTRGHAESSTLSSGISLGSSEGSELSEEMSWPAFERTRFYHSLGPVTRVARIPYRGVLRPSRLQWAPALGFLLCSSRQTQSSHYLTPQLSQKSLQFTCIPGRSQSRGC